jgi:hypothetical protein
MFFYLTFFIYLCKKINRENVKGNMMRNYLVTISPTRLLQVGLEGGRRQFRTPGHFDFVGADLCRETHKIKIHKLKNPDHVFHLQ